MIICGEQFNVEPSEGGRLTAVSVRDSMFFFNGANHADLRRKMPSEKEAWQAERLKAAKQMQADADAYVIHDRCYVPRKWLQNVYGSLAR